MYTGVVEWTGTVESATAADEGGTVRVATDTADLEPGDSIAVSGVCLTAESVGDGWFEASLSADTATRTYLLDLEAGEPVNIERPLPADGRFDGHVVKGTVDTTTTVAWMTERADDWWLSVDVPEGYEQFVVEKGAVALDGVGLTVAAVDDEAGTIGVAVVPETYERTTLSETEAGDPIHFEADILAKYATRRAGLAAAADDDDETGSATA